MKNKQPSLPSREERERKAIDKIKAKTEAPERTASTSSVGSISESAERTYRDLQAMDNRLSKEMPFHNCIVVLNAILLDIKRNENEPLGKRRVYERNQWKMDDNPQTSRYDAIEMEMRGSEATQRKPQNGANEGCQRIAAQKQQSAPSPQEEPEPRTKSLGRRRRLQNKRHLRPPSISFLA